MDALSRRTFGAAILATLAGGKLPAADAQSLFNGRDLSGWSVREGPESAFYVSDGVIMASPASAYPAWLATTREYENFDLSFEFFLKGWIDGGLYIHAPEHGRPSTCGIKVNIFHQQEETPHSNSMGSIFPLIAPAKANAHKAGWNTMRVVCDWPKLQVTINDAVVQDVNLQQNAELSRRLRRGYLGFTALSYPLQLRNIRVAELPSKERWTTLFEGPEDMAKWHVEESDKRNPARFEAWGNVLHADGLGYLATKDPYKDFDLQMYFRGSHQHNGGVIFRSDAKGQGNARRYEIQLHDVPEAHYPTGSLYHFKRSSYPNIQDEQWSLLQLLVQGPRCQVRIDGDTVMEYSDLKDMDPGYIELQAHQAGRWVEYKQIRVKAL
jgi:hypothetical protein